jgi:hypothetical protein
VTSRNTQWALLPDSLCPKALLDQSDVIVSEINLDVHWGMSCDVT